MVRVPFYDAAVTLIDVLGSFMVGVGSFMAGLVSFACAVLLVIRGVGEIVGLIILTFFRRRWHGGHVIAPTAVPNSSS